MLSSVSYMSFRTLLFPEHGCHHKRVNAIEIIKTVSLKVKHDGEQDQCISMYIFRVPPLKDTSPARSQ